MINGVSIALIVFNEELNLARALASLEDPGTAWEILVIDNGSRDGTKRAFESFREKNPTALLRWIDHRPNNLGAARALALTESKFPVVGFIDADCVAPAGWAKRAVGALQALESDPQVLGLGSGNRPPEDRGTFNHALALQLSSKLGHLNTPQARLLNEAREVEHLPTCNVFLFRDRAMKAGNFSAAFSRVCEDLEFSLRARGQGWKFLYQPGMEVIHIQSGSWSKWAAKMFRYGWGQIEVARLHPTHLRGTKALPLLAALLAMPWLIAHPRSFLAFMIFYLGITWLYSAGICFGRRKPRLTPHVFCLFVLTHFFYSAGELWGLFRQIKRGKMNQGKREQARLGS